MKPGRLIIPLALAFALLAPGFGEASPLLHPPGVHGPAPVLHRALGPGPETVPPAPAPDASPVAPAVAESALEGAAAALAGDAPQGDATSALAELAQVYPALQGGQRRRATALLARPTDGARDRFGDGYTAPVFSVYSANYCYFWVDSGRDAAPQTDTNANGVPDFVEATAFIAENSHTVEHGTLGFRTPPSDGPRGCTAPDGKPRIDAYLKDLKNLYGYVAADPGQRRDRQHSYLVLDNDMAEFLAQYGSVIPPLEVTVAHEYNHVIQYGYAFLQDTWFKESTATWIEEQVYPAVNDYLQYIGSFARQVAVPITKANGGLKIYGSAVWNHWLSGRYGTSIIERAWRSSHKTRPVDLATKAYERAISQASGGRSNFLAEFVGFAAATAEWNSTTVFPDSALYPDMRRSGTLRTSDRFYKRFTMNHTTYRLADVPVRAGSAVKLKVFAPRGVAGGLALVGRIGSGAGATVETVTKVLRHGGKGAVRLPDPARFERITAVVVNGEGGVRGFNPRIGDWNYRGDHARFDAGVFQIG
jgi:hypothetical protein